MIRISSGSPETVVVSRPGKHPLLVEKHKAVPIQEETAEKMDMDEAPLLLEPRSRFSSTITTMDVIPS